MIDLFTQVKQFVSASADPGKLFRNTVQYHIHLYSSGDHCGYMFRMYVSRTEVNFFSCDHTFLYEYIYFYFLLKTYSLLFDTPVHYIVLYIV